MPLRTKLYTHIFADNEHWSWQKFAVKRDKSVQFMEKEEWGNLRASGFCQWAFLFNDPSRTKRTE